jgi:hypothetical protein
MMSLLRANYHSLLQQQSRWGLISTMVAQRHNNRKYITECEATKETGFEFVHDPENDPV